MHFVVAKTMRITYLSSMKTVKQKQIAEWLGVSEQLVCDIKKKRRTFGKQTAYRLSDVTGISYQELSLINGPAMMKKLSFAYLQNKEFEQ